MQPTLKSTIEKSGVPDEFSASQAIWHNNAPWKQTIVRSQENPHDFPACHDGVLEPLMNYRVTGEEAHEEYVRLYQACQDE